MRGHLTLVVLALSLSSQGCALVSDGVHIVKSEVEESVDDCLERIRNRKWATAAWEKVCGTDPHAYSKSYAEGFKAGFADHLYCGAEEPPLVAPAPYRRLRYQSPEGYHAIVDWFAGYRHGVAMAKETGSRRWITGPFAGSPQEPALANGQGPVDGSATIELSLPAPSLGAPEGVQNEIGLPTEAAKTPSRLPPG